mgnify:CR=1 FL=1
MRILVVSALLASGLLPAGIPAKVHGAAGDAIVPESYESCMAEAKTSPEQAFEKATAWAGLNGGDAARHCAAVALIGLGHQDEAARRLQALAQEIYAEAAVKAAILGQAGQAWLLAGDAAAAENVLSAAINLDPRNADLYVDRAQALDARGDVGGAVRDLTQALSLDDNLVDARVFRASAYRQLDRLDDAARDIVEALKRDPKNIEGLLERGILRRLVKDPDGARRDWLQVIEIAPDSEAARLSRDNIELLDGPNKNKQSSN